MKYKLNNNIRLGLIKDKLLDYKPLFLLGNLDVYLTPIREFSILEKEKTKWFGIDSWLYQEGDSWLFDPQNKMLKYVCFVMPEKNLVPPNIDFVFSSIGTEGMLTLSDDPTEFELESMTYRFYSFKHSALVCFNDNFLSSSDSFNEVVFAENISMIFTKHGYSGWKLKNPELYILDKLSSELPDRNDTSEFIKKCFSKALEIIEIDNIDRIDGGKNETPLKEMSHLYETIKTSDCADNKILAVIANWLFDVADRFYPEDKVKAVFR